MFAGLLNIAYWWRCIGRGLHVQASNWEINYHRTPAPLYIYPRKDLPGGISS